MIEEFKTWNNINSLINAVKLHIKHVGLTKVYGVPRGGLIPAVMLSHKMGLDLITDINEIDNKTVLIDDICDSGKTFANYQALIQEKPIFVSLYLRHSSKFKTDYSAVEIKNNNWITFPWERKT